MKAFNTLICMKIPYDGTIILYGSVLLKNDVSLLNDMIVRINHFHYHLLHFADHHHRL